jgi:hypothetical protein
MRNFFLFLIVLVLQFSIATSQTLQWAKQFGGTQVDIATSNAIDQAGNIYVTGFTEASSPDCFIYKTDSNGVILWNKIIGGSGVDGSNEIVCDDNTEASSPDCFIYKTDSNGVIIYRIGSSGYFWGLC